MWNSLKGVLTYRGRDRIYLLVNDSLEWTLLASLSTLQDLPKEGECIRLFTYLQHKEDEMTLFGFTQELERSLFLQLLSVNGIGSKVALRVLSFFTPYQLQEVLEKEDLQRLSSVKGLGKKTAQKILLTLKGKLVGFSEDMSEKPRWFSDILESVVSMGFESKKVQGILQEIEKSFSSETKIEREQEKEIFSQVLLKLSQ